MKYTKNNMQFLSLFISIFIFALFGCSSEEPETEPKVRVIDGDIFIVMQSAQNLKLGLVEVYAVDTKNVNDHVDKALKASKLKIEESSYLKGVNDFAQKGRELFESIETEYEKCLDSITVLRNRQDKLMKVDVEFLKAQEKYYDFLDRQDNKPKDGFIHTKPIEEYKKVFKNAVGYFDEYNEKVDFSQKLIDENKDQFIRISTLKRLFKQSADDFLKEVGNKDTLISTFVSELESDVSNGSYKSEKTDADGKFQLTLDADNNYTLIATASRKLLDSTEFYYWVVNLDSSDTKVFLSNDNMNRLDYKILEESVDCRSQINKIKLQRWYNFEMPNLTYSKVEIPITAIPDLDN